VPLRARLLAWPWPAAAALALVSQTALATPLPSPLPDRFERYLSTVIRPSTRDRDRLLAGEPITKLVDTGDSSEVAVFGAVWIHAAPQKYVDAMNNIETFERGAGFQLTKRISNPPRAEDFAALTLSPVDVRDLQSCRLDDCKVKLDQATIEAIRKRVDFAKSTAANDAAVIVRERLLEEAGAYRTNGNAALPVYRDDDHPLTSADEFKTMVDRMPEFAELIPELKPYLLGSPAAALHTTLDFLYWQNVSFGLKPTLRMTHVVSYAGAAGTVVASKMIYGSHYFRSALELRVLIADPARGDGFWFITVNRSRLDGLTGLFGFFIRGRVRGDVQKGALTVLAATKRKLEPQSRTPRPGSISPNRGRAKD
jgi:hypothetical protein